MIGNYQYQILNAYVYKDNAEAEGPEKKDCRTA